MAAVRTFSVAKTLISNSCFSISTRSVTYSAVSRELRHVSYRSSPDMISDRSNRVVESDNSWGPDPVTGFYRPANRASEMDVADLRNMLLKKRIALS